MADPKLDHPSYRPSDLTLEEASKAPGGIDFIAEKNKIDEEWKLPVNGTTRATWVSSLARPPAVACFSMTLNLS